MCFAVRRHKMEQERSVNRGGNLHSFSVGLEGSPDIAAAEQVAAMIGTTHHSFTFTVEEGLDAVRDVVWFIESYEQIRASVPMYILSRRIKSLGFKVRRDAIWCAPAVYPQ